MKKTQKIIVLVLAFAMIISLSACSKKPIDYKKFRDILEDKFDFDVEKNSSPQEGIDVQYFGEDKDAVYCRVFLRSDNLVIILGSKSGKDKDVDRINDIVKALGY